MRQDIIVPVHLLKKKLDVDLLQIKSIKGHADTKNVIGQKRAIKALRFGLSVKHQGYNVYISGVPGTGRNTFARAIAQEFAMKGLPPDDWCYVYNFDKPFNPKAIRLRAGEGVVLKEQVKNMVTNLKEELPRQFASKSYEEKKNHIIDKFEKKTEKVIKQLNQLAWDFGFQFQQTDNGLISYPLVDDRPMTEEELEELEEDALSHLKEQSNKLSEAGYDIIKDLKDIEDELRQTIKNLKEGVAKSVIAAQVEEIYLTFVNNSEVTKFLKDLQEDMIKNLETFLEAPSDKSSEKKERKSGSIDRRYDVNLFIDNSHLKGKPIVREMNPNYYNLLGKIEYFNQSSSIKTDHTKIKPGAIHEANGGYLILQAKDILNSSSAWDGLKRTLISKKITIENLTKGSVLAETIKPEPIPIELKVIIVGDYHTYQVLYHYDEDFQKLFRIKADFDIEIERNKNNIEKLFTFVHQHCRNEDLKPFSEAAVAEIIEYSSRLAENQEKITARFNEIVELLYEANALAGLKDAKTVTKEHIVEAIEDKFYRNNKYEEKLHEMVDKEIILIQTRGGVVGQINGLSVLDLGQYSFGRPNKITVATFAGKDGIVNIEREVDQSGSTYDKGVMILQGYLGEKYAKRIPLSLTASITFEQSYGMIDGDSASSTELYAILSSLSGVPINQGIAVTGSVNQKGIIQPIGGVNEKIEGFYKICKIKGFTGGEGVMIPYQNITNLMLRDEVIEAVKERKFTIYAVKSIDEGIEILTGMKAGQMDQQGNYPPGTVNFLVQRRLNYYASLYMESD